MNIRIAVLRGQSTIQLKVVEGSYLLCSGKSERLIPVDSSLIFQCQPTNDAHWIVRTLIHQPQSPFDIQTGVTAIFQNDRGEKEWVHSHRFFQISEAESQYTPDSFYTHALSIGQSEKVGYALLIPDERRSEQTEMTVGTTVVQAPAVLYPQQENCKVSIQDVRIGIGFHWDHLQTLTYAGKVSIEKLKTGLCAVIECPLEDYLASVNSSEMPADLPIEFLKAQTVAARSWLLRNLGTHHIGAPFDICSDDHCQCFHGNQKLQHSSVLAAQETLGEILICQDPLEHYLITDARYAKTCGGRFEPGETIWGGKTPGLVYGAEQTGASPIESEKDAFQILKDREQKDYCNSRIYSYPASLQYASPFYRWERLLDIQTLCQYIYRSTGKVWNEISVIEVLKRGPSGRIHTILLKNSDDCLEVNGELAIRRLFSDSHLPSSAFVIERNGSSLLLSGAGWGHGAGLCQTGGTVRAILGQNYREILKTYYPTSILVKTDQIIR